ncbi:MAG: glycosyltransferase family 2 protein [Schaedlerella sp.]|nr:glycosyltransferase family 2 protein [Schaedlerella sp.]
MENNKKVSIVVPVYNMGSRIINSVKSIMNQSYSNLEIILVDDGSKDDSLDNCNYLSTIDSRVKVFHTENHGSGPARNYGISKATGDYVYFPDADDFIETETIAILESVMTKHSCDLVVFGYRNVTSEGYEISTKSYEYGRYNGDYIRGNYSEHMTTLSRKSIQGAPWNKFFNLDLIKRNNIEYPPLRRHQDEAFIARYVSHIDSVVFIEDILYNYYVNDLKREWDKYPTTYIDAVNGLFKERQQNILTWNENDYATHEMVYKEYICNTIKALELSFSPKFNFNKRKRYSWMEDVISKSSFTNVGIPSNLDRYHSWIYKKIKSGNIKVAYQAMQLKVFVEKNGLLDPVKRMLKKQGGNNESNRK